MESSYENILEDVIRNIKIDEAFELYDLQNIQDEFAHSLNIASVMMTMEGTLITRPSNFSILCKNYIRKSEIGLNDCRKIETKLTNESNHTCCICQCLSSGLVDGGVYLTIGDRPVISWMFGQIRYSEEIVSEEVLRENALLLQLDEEKFVSAYRKTTVMTAEQFQHVTAMAVIIARKFSEEANLKCVHLAEEKYKHLIENNMKENRERLQNENAIDSLTKMFTRNYFEKEVSRLQLLQIVPVAVIVADVNNLKATNDIFGHKFGDQLLSEISRIMMQESFEGFILGRCGGDEFNILIPGGNRQSADWYCNRVTRELKKNFNCCLMPSLALGVAKKDKVEQSFRDVLENADIKMYRQKISMKQRESLIDSIRTVLIGKKRLNESIVSKVYGMTIELSDFLKFDEYKKDLFIRMTEIHNYGIVILSEEDFAKRFDLNRSIEERRELSKLPVIASKVANMVPAYSSVAEYEAAFYENWDGSGLPNALKENEIPDLCRYGRILCDFIYIQEEQPIGLGKDQKAAIQYLKKFSGKLYDPVAVKVFMTFINNRIA